MFDWRDARRAYPFIISRIFGMLTTAICVSVCCSFSRGFPSGEVLGSMVRRMIASGFKNAVPVD